MGGLISKLQVTSSGDRIWREIAKKPLDEILTDEKTRAELARLTFFEPSPYVSRVVFIATPHGGGLPYSALVGNAASHLVTTPAAQEAMHAQLMADNPGVFRSWVQKGFPTSIDMLASESPLLTVMREMPVQEGVALHNIIGVSHWLSTKGPSDCVVSMNSAEHPNCQSVLIVPEGHTKVHNSWEASQEVWRILTMHCAAEPTQVWFSRN